MQMQIELVPAETESSPATPQRVKRPNAESMVTWKRKLSPRVTGRVVSMAVATWNAVDISHASLARRRDAGRACQKPLLAASRSMRMQ